MGVAGHLFALKQAPAAFDFCDQQLVELDAQLQAQLESLRVSRRARQLG